MKRIFLTGSTSYLGTKFIDLYQTKFEIFGVAQHDDKHPLDLLNVEELTKLYNDFRPDIVIHLAADLGRDVTASDEITKTNPQILQNLITLALPNKTPLIFTSTEAVYGGKWDTGDYVETDAYEPRSPYGQSKVTSEKLLIASGLPYLITRGHRHVGISPRFHKVKWFPDTLKDITENKVVHLDSKKIFNPVLINNICDIFAYYMENDIAQQIIINMGVGKKTTYYDFIVDVANNLKLDVNLIKSDGNEAGWPANSSLNVSKIKQLGYPSPTYEEVLSTIATDFKHLRV